MKSEKMDIVIASLEYARGRLLKGETFDFAELSNYLLTNSYFKPEDSGMMTDFLRALHLQMTTTPESFNPRRWMSLDAYLGLLDYEELQLAREESVRARKDAKVAIDQAAEATRLTESALFWTKVSVIAAIVVGVAQIILTFVVK